VGNGVFVINFSADFRNEELSLPDDLKGIKNFEYISSENNGMNMKSIELNDPSEIEQFLSKISFTGKGFTSDSLLLEVYEAGLDYPDFLKAEGEDPDASYDGKSPAWAKYHVRQGKRVFMVYGGSTGNRRTHFSETP
jgi:hypothetical protein